MPYLTWDQKIEYHKKRSDAIAEHILLKIEEGVDNWEMPWHKGIPMAKNRVTGKYYRGNNHLILWDECMQKGYSQNLWATMRQWNRFNSGVKRGEHGTLIKFVIPRDELETYDQLEIEFEDGEAEEENGFRIFFNYVFNVDQVTNNREGQVSIFDDMRPEEVIIDDFIQRTEAQIEHVGIEAFYRVTDDKIRMPPIAAFRDTEDAEAMDHYYSVLLHELIHWTGHQSRCNRKLLNVFGSPLYAFEELVAELGTAVLTTQFKKRLTPRENHAKYVNSWLQVLKHDFNFFIQALELAKTATLWLFDKTQILPDPIPEYYKQEVTDKLVTDLEDSLGSESSEKILAEITEKWELLGAEKQNQVIRLIRENTGDIG